MKLKNDEIKKMLEILKLIFFLKNMLNFKIVKKNWIIQIRYEKINSSFNYALLIRLKKTFISIFIIKYKKHRKNNKENTVFKKFLFTIWYFIIVKSSSITFVWK